MILQHDNILTPIGFADGFGPLPSIVYDWMPGGTLTSYLEENFDSLSVLRKFYLASLVHSFFLNTSKLIKQIEQIADGLCYCEHYIGFHFIYPDSGF